MVTEDVRERVRSYIQHQAQKPKEEIAEMVAESQGRLLGVLSAHDDESAAKPEAAGEWCLHDLTRHVVGSEEGVARLVERLARGETAKREGQPGQMVDGDGGYRALLDRLRTANASMLAAIRALPADPDTETKSPHPFFGDLNCYEWAVFQRVHDSDHIQHAQKIIAATTGSA
jgi:DinB superfamily